MKYVVEEYAHGFTRQIGETTIGVMALMAARQNAADRKIETRVLSEDGRSCYSVLPGGREIIPYDLKSKPVKNDLIAELEQQGDA